MVEFEIGIKVSLVVSVPTESGLISEMFGSQIMQIFEWSDHPATCSLSLVIRDKLFPVRPMPLLTIQNVPHSSRQLRCDYGDTQYITNHV
ncbi:hypothetical protein EVAR_18295_1 [Eumeta japonica]|uniref:Uncharacterized protein n=1 Tax=Eumeta variegata TaxID=151549 RepID=A0A4C1V9F7_EUMVA|nr:hypothetical protein EVAR_18295_1 [Eumeta japonica]